ncbi:radical SAM protein [Pseudovibrio ascidiaceicola]|uniref:radical SAM protein n=1 Tax=Pseudovibrio ascidiaceicola TaxID=285279 RepID=UPI003D359EAA
MEKKTLGEHFAPKFDHLSYIRVFEGCNLHCAHCFIPKNPKRMSHDDVAAAGRKLKEIAEPGQTVMIQWHGGEPTLFGAEWMRQAIEALHANTQGLTLKHAIQTNLMTFDEDWAQLYHDHFESKIGVSWDPVIRMMPGARAETNALYEEKFWNQIEAVKAANIEPDFVVTATKPFFERFKSAFSLFEFFSNKGIRYIHIERLTYSGYAKTNWDTIGVSNYEYSTNMARLLRSYSAWRENNRDKQTSISPFDGLLIACQELESHPKAYGCWSTMCDKRFHTFDANGYQPGCTALTAEPLFPTNTSFDLLISKERAERQRKTCQTCKFRSICSTGCVSVSMDDGSGECAGSRRLFESALFLTENDKGISL